MGKLFTPWVGKNWNSTKVLILSESAYSWRDDNANIRDPPHRTRKKLFFGRSRNFLGEDISQA